MNPPSIRIWRVVWFTACFTCCAFLAMQGVQRTPWYQNRLYDQLVSGTPNQRLAAASGLARVGAEPFLLAGLKSAQPDVRELSRRGLEQIWFVAAGRKAFTTLEKAHRALDQEDYPGALEVLNSLVARYPKYAEGWNRRASLYWQIGEYEKSIVDCERVLSLNPNHFGAWQGIGVCHLHLGDLAEACQALEAALKILPHDQATRDSLRKCRELLRSYPSPTPNKTHHKLL